MSHQAILDRLDRSSRRADLLTDVAIFEARERIHERADAVRADRAEQREMQRENREQCAALQAEWNEALRPLGLQADSPRVGETSFGYDVRMLRHARAQAPDGDKVHRYRVDSTCDNAYVEGAKQEIKEMLAREAIKPTGSNLARTVDEARAQRIVVDPHTNLRTIQFNAAESFIKSLNRTGHKVRAFFVDGKPLSVSRRPLRWDEML
jgi:hypothetical protein